MRVVFDTSIYIATLIAPTSRGARVYWAWRNGRFILLTYNAFEPGIAAYPAGTPQAVP